MILRSGRLGNRGHYVIESVVLSGGAHRIRGKRRAASTPTRNGFTPGPTMRCAPRRAARPARHNPRLLRPGSRLGVISPGNRRRQTSPQVDVCSRVRSPGCRRPTSRCRHNDDLRNASFCRALFENVYSITGPDRVRFLAPVMAGQRVRCRARLRSLDARADGSWRVVTENTLELEGSQRPAMVADWITYHAPAPASGGLES